ncbi:aldo/keto reductase [Arthrobacter sp. NicSoilB8]|jgi:aryl-alcohol dehydrogenase-like predicted oxidoreductase|uniref:aldo/keto reductase n=1 Tax=Arthrobacter sp. NicSoilB8 TaxID=2830998 RepID=UPI001CC807D2|nr:aldo/keto reductase [Arthrobacter sp. NicSoilB8]BCW72713.1 oxidoreductase [Arthrobacter sp. NicSoilB8]
MLKRNFGSSSLQVSALGFGAGHIGYDGVTESQAHGLLDRALELGINFIDTARGYGLSEERIGSWLPARRSDVVLSTKVGYGVEGAADWSAAAVTRGVHEALAKLGTDRIDVVFLHSCPLAVLQRGEAVQALLACVEAGKVRVPGYSGENEALAWAASAGVFGAVQSSVNLADQRSLREVLPVAARNGLGVVAKRPLANAPWRHADRPAGVYGETYWDRLGEMGLEPEADDWPGTALRFSVFSPGVSTAIVGTSQPANLETAAAAVARGPLPDAERQRWEAAFAGHAGEWAGEV